LITYDEFLSLIEEQVSELAGDEYNVRIVPVRRNNGVMLDSMLITKPGDMICPNIYLNAFYDCYQEGMSIPAVAERIMIQYRSTMPGGRIDIEELLSRDAVCGNVVYRVVNRSRNEDILKDVPHRDFLDLSLVYYVIVRNDQIGEGAVLVHREHQKLWKISDDELDLAAKENTRRLLPPDVVSIAKMLGELSEKMETGTYTGSDGPGDEDSGEENTPMYVLTNSCRQFGACYLADNSVLSKLAEKEDDDLYILPSSVHECMIVPYRYEDDPEDLGKMVREINRTQVDEEEFLSDCVYYYDRVLDRVEIAA
jgi:hypothetical protein